MHSFDAYEDGMRRLLKKLGRTHERYTEALTLQSRLQENLDAVHKYGDNEIHRTDRAQIVEALNRLALEAVAVSFNKLCKEQELLSPIPEKEVRELLEAMGYRIADTQTVGTDIYFLCDVKWGVEIYQEVIHFVGDEPTPSDIATLNDATVSHDAVRGVLLTRQPLSPALRTLSSQRKHIRCFTLEEFIDRLADFRPYLERLIQEHESSEIPSFYVPLTAESEIGVDRLLQVYEPLESLVDAWLTESGRNHLSILGDFGSGKTWFCQHYAYLTAKRYLTDPAHNRIPILIILRDYSRAYDVEQLITDAIANRYKVSLVAGYKTFSRLNEAGRLLLIFDGFDEMERRISDYRTTVDNFWELAKVVGPTSKVILTCRTAYFRHRDEEKETLAPRHRRVSVITGDQVIDLRDRQGFEVVHLIGFEDEDIQQALRKRLPFGWEPMYQKIQEIANLRDMASRPVLLDMIVKTIPQIQDARQVNQAILYETYVDALMKRRWREDTDYITPQGRLFFMQELAWEMYQTQRLSIPFSEFPDRVIQYFGFRDAPERAAFFERDVRTQSYLVRDDIGNYRFAHKSFMEYFVACKMAKAVSSPDFEIGKAIEVWKTYPLAVEVVDFLTDMITDLAPLWQLVEATRGKSISDVGYAGGNATRVLSVLENESIYALFDFSNTVLPGANLAGKIMRNTNLENAILTGADLTAADLSDANLQRADLQGTRLTFAHLVGADMSFADLHDVNIREFDQVRDIVFSPDGRSLAIAVANQVIMLDLAGNIKRQTIYSTYFRCVAFHPDGQCIVAGAADGLVRGWDVDSLTEVMSIRPVRTVYSLAFAPDGAALFVAGNDGECVALNWADATIQATYKSVGRGKMRASLYSSDGKYIVLGGEETSEIEIWERSTSRKVRAFSLPDSGVMSLALTKNDQRLACGGTNGYIYIFDFTTGIMLTKWLVEERTDRGRWIWDVRYTRDGRWLVSDGPHQTVAIWDAMSGECVRLLEGHTYRLSAVALSLDDKLIATGGIDATVRLWNVSNGVELQCFEQRMDCRGLKIQGIKTNYEVLTKFLIERGATED